MRNRALFTALAGAALLPALVTPAFASDERHDRWGQETYQAHLEPVPHHPKADSGSNVTGSAKVVEVDGKLKVAVTAYGLSPLLPHLMHIHGELEAANECPGKEFRAGGVDDRLIETADGLPAYGPIQVTFSTAGDTSAAAGLALDTAPVADERGNLSYQRVLLDVPAEIRDELDDLHIVIHGEDLDDDGMYDGEPITALGAPLEAELPVACGELDARSGHGKWHDKGHDKGHHHRDGHGHSHG